MSLLTDAFASESYASEGAPLLPVGISKAKIKEVTMRKDKETQQDTNDLIVTFEGVGEFAGKEWSWYIFESNFDESKCTEDWHGDALIKSVNQLQHVISAFFDEEKVKAKFAAVKTAKDVISLAKAALGHDMAKAEADIKLVYDGKNRLSFPKGGKTKQGKFFVTNFLSTELNSRQITLNLNFDKLEQEKAPESNDADDEFGGTDTVQETSDSLVPNTEEDDEVPF